LQWNEATLEDEVSAAIRANKVRSLDAASANGRLFLLVAGVGLDGRIVHELDRIRRGPISYASYVLPAAQAIGSYDYPSLSVTVDGHVIVRDQPSLAFVGNVKEYGTGFPLLPRADPSDGLLDVCVMPCGNWKAIVQMFLRAAAGEHLQCEGVKYLKGKSIHIASPHPVEVQVDGEAFGHTPVEIGLLGRKLGFIVPEVSV
jgi:diacylglycerol kinase family enzyme